MQIGLYFGSFNPIHTGHCIIGSFMAGNTDLEQVWMVVSPQNPLKPQTSLLNEYHRLHMAQKAVENDPYLKISDIEFHLPRPSFTIDTLTYLEEKYPQHQFSVIMGSDSFQNISRWKNGDLLLKKYRIYIYQRPQFPVTEKTAANIIVVKAPILEISSTHIRDCIKNKKSIRYLVPDLVQQEIMNNGYYK